MFEKAKLFVEENQKTIVKVGVAVGVAAVGVIVVRKLSGSAEPFALEEGMAEADVEIAE